MSRYQIIISNLYGNVFEMEYVPRFQYICSQQNFINKFFLKHPVFLFNLHHTVVKLSYYSPVASVLICKQINTEIQLKVVNRITEINNLCPSMYCIPFIIQQFFSKFFLSSILTLQLGISSALSVLHQMILLNILFMSVSMVILPKIARTLS